MGPAVVANVPKSICRFGDAEGTSSDLILRGDEEYVALAALFADAFAGALPGSRGTNVDET
eukprot:m.176608 g.176608  ORF g.176608 m.176608 type:complete len:61 (-) comp24454_c0_seq1:998-1180(-)